MCNGRAICHVYADNPKDALKKAKKKIKKNHLLRYEGETMENLSIVKMV